MMARVLMIYSRVSCVKKEEEKSDERPNCCGALHFITLKCISRCVVEIELVLGRMLIERNKWM